MVESLTERIENLDDKHAITVAQRLSQAVFTNQSAPTWTVLAAKVDEAGRDAGVELQLAERPSASRVQLSDAEGGELARAVLSGWAADAGMAPAVDRAIQEYEPTTQDFGIISVAVAIGLVYVLVSMDADISLGPLGRIKKAGLTPDQQTDVLKKTLGPVAKVLGFGA